MATPKRSCARSSHERAHRQSVVFRDDVPDASGQASDKAAGAHARRTSGRFDGAWHSAVLDDRPLLRVVWHSIQTAIGAGVNAFGDRMGGLGEQMARMLTSAWLLIWLVSLPPMRCFIAKRKQSWRKRAVRELACQATASHCTAWTRVHRRFSTSRARKARSASIAGSVWRSRMRSRDLAEAKRCQ